MYKVKSHHTGFSLVELMVSISIFMVVTAVTLTSYPKFSNRLSLDLLAEDIALSIRQAQIFGSSVLGARGGVGLANIFTAYGVHFEEPDMTSPNYNYLIFADVANPPSGAGKIDRQYNGLDANGLDFPCPFVNENGGIGPIAESECLQKFQITGFNRVSALCSNFEVAPTKEERVADCLSNKKNQVKVLDIIFVRPNLDALFTMKDGAKDIVDSSNVPSVGIVLESPGGEYHKTVVVWKTGQISVE